MRSVGGNNTTIVELQVAEMDVGKVIDKNGRTVGVIRTIIKAVSSKEKKPTILEIAE